MYICMVVCMYVCMSIWNNQCTCESGGGWWPTAASSTYKSSAKLQDDLFIILELVNSSWLSAALLHTATWLRWHYGRHSDGDSGGGGSGRREEQAQTGSTAAAAATRTTRTSTTTRRRRRRRRTCDYSGFTLCTALWSRCATVAGEAAEATKFCVRLCATDSSMLVYASTYYSIGSTTT